MIRWWMATYLTSNLRESQRLWCIAPRARLGVILVVTVVIVIVVVVVVVVVKVVHTPLS